MRRLFLALSLVCVLSAVAASSASAKTRWVTYRAGAFDTGDFNVLLPKEFVRAPKPDGYITDMYATLHYANGRRVSIRRVMLHHLVFLNAGAARNSKRTSCAGRSGQPFWGTGEEHEYMHLPKGYGYPVAKTDRWRMQMMLMSHAMTYQRVYLEYRFRFVTGVHLKAVRPFWVRANGCNPQPSYTVPGGGGPGSKHIERYHWTVPFNGRIVAAGGHLHGGAESMTLQEPSCSDRTLLDTNPMYGKPSDLVYRIRPILHEPGPISTHYYESGLGVPVHKGERLVVDGVYDNEYARARVMSIMHLYVYPTRNVGKLCGALPNVQETFRRTGGRMTPPYEKIPLNYLGNDGKIHAFGNLPGPIQPLTSGATVDLIHDAFAKQNIVITSGSSITWKFADPEAHNVLLASGPAVVGATTLSHGAKKTQRFTVPGRYQLFCYLHPITMHEQVTVLAPGQSAATTGLG